MPYESALDVEDFPECCAAVIISNFWDLDHENPGIRKQMRDDIKEAVQDNRDIMIVAITADYQKRANKLLTKLGFRGTVWKKKPNHGKSMIKLWWKDPKKVKTRVVY